MNKRKPVKINYEVNKLSVDITELQSILSVGRNTARKIGQAAKAEIKVGRRKLYNFKKIEEYINSLTD